MARSSRQKRKILILAQLLLRETDENHPMTVAQMIRALEAQGILSERKSIYADLEELRDFGLDIIKTYGNTVGYFIGSRHFELPEVRLLVDAVQSSRFLTKKKSEELIEKLESLASRHEAKTLSHNVFVSNRIKTMNDSIYRNVDAIGEALEKKNKIRFRYFDWDIDGKKEYRRDGEFYTVSPFFLIWNDESYYLLCVEEESGERRHFRVDKMNSVTRLEEKREGAESFRDFDPALYGKKMFGMFSGREERVTLWCDPSLAGVFYDRFGEHLAIQKSQKGFITTLPIFVSPMFYAWLAGFGERVRILAPESAKQEFCAWLSCILSGYEKTEELS